MSTTRKTRSDSKLDGLPPNQREALERWLFDESPRLSCSEAVSRLWQDFSVRSSETAVRSFFKRARQARLEEQALESIVADAKSANLLLEKSEENAANFRQVTERLMAQLAMKKALAGEELSMEEMVGISMATLAGRKEDREDKKLAIKVQELKLQERKVAMAEMKSKATQAVEETAKGGRIDAATKRELLEAIDRKLTG